MELYTDYQPGAVLTSTPMGGGGEDPLDAFIRDRLNQLRTAQTQARLAQPNRLGARATRGAPSPVLGKKSALDRIAEERARMELDARRAELKQLNSPPPLRPRPLKYGGGEEMIRTTMTPIQRQMFLPQGSAFAYSPSEEAGARQKAIAEAAWSAKMAADRARFAEKGY